MSNEKVGLIISQIIFTVASICLLIPVLTIIIVMIFQWNSIPSIFWIFTNLNPFIGIVSIINGKNLGDQNKKLGRWSIIIGIIMIIISLVVYALSGFGVPK